MDRLIKDAQEDLNRRNKRKVSRQISQAKDDLQAAISNLDLSEEADQNLERSMLDIAIHISLLILELSLYERIIQGQDRPLSK